MKDDGTLVDVVRTLSWCSSLLEMMVLAVSGVKFSSPVYKRIILQSYNMLLFV